MGLLPLLSIVLICVIGVITYSVLGKKTARTGVLTNYGQGAALFLFYKKNIDNTKTIENTGPSSLDGNLASDAGTIVPLLGNENSPEMLVEIACSLNTRNAVQTVNITEVPNQTFLEALNTDTPKILSIERRLKRLSKNQDMDVDFESLVTHDVSNTVAELSGQTNCDWLVLGWDGRAHSGLLVRNPIGWLLTNINSNFALFKDNGIKNIGRVVLALRPGRKDRNFLKVAERICKSYGSSLTLLHIVTPDFPKDQALKMKKKSASLLSELKIQTDLKIVESENPTEMVSKVSAEHDLLILGAPEKNSWLNVLFGGGRDKFTENAACSVLRLTIKN